jgi:hypothetical protein
LYFLGTGGGLLEKQAQELHVLRLLVSLLDGGLLEKQAQELHVLRLLVLYWTADYWKTSTGASRTQATCFITGRRITERRINWRRIYGSTRWEQSFYLLMRSNFLEGKIFL